jgi:hypothetical protein
MIYGKMQMVVSPLVDYFSNNTKLILNKKILHVAPEENLKKYFLGNIKKYRIINYHINDFTNEANFNFNIENILLKKYLRFDYLSSCIRTCS